jgi:antitoxin component YwqK of YwqJK toxin-antitoxin module
MKKLLYILVLFLPFLSFAQLNQKDANGKKQGVWQKKYPGSNTFIYKGQFKDDKAIGEFTYYYESGKIKSVIKHFPNSNLSFAVFYSENEAVLSEGFYKNQLKDSTWLNFTSSGALSSKDCFLQNQLHGEKIIYYIEGQIENGVLIPLSISNYNKDLQDGLYTEFFSTGKIKKKGIFQNGLKDGEWLEYHPNGQIAQKAKFKKDNLHTWVYSYDKNGLKISEVFFQNGTRLIGKELDLFFENCTKNGIDPND